MKNLMSYFDIPIIVLVIYMAFLKWKKQNKDYKERKEQLELDRSMGISNTADSNSLRISDRYAKQILLLVIVCGILAVFFRLKGSMPNVFLIIVSMIDEKIQSIKFFIEEMN